MAFMREAIPLLEREPLIEMYAWFSMFEDDWLYPIVDGKNGDAGLVYSTSSTNLYVYMIKIIYNIISCRIILYCIVWISSHIMLKAYDFNIVLHYVILYYIVVILILYTK